MNFIREIVGGPKNRFKDNQFNLDLTYITSRIIAMAFPASGIQKVFRNSIDTVADFLQERHKDSYIIINVSTREIDENKLKNVHSFFWEDHKSPRFFLLFHLAKLISQFLGQKQDNVVVVHCNHGKGRTGTLICCLLLYLGAMESQKQAMMFYAKRRFQVEGMGVTQPCQRLYIKYFSMLIKDFSLYPKPLSLFKIVIRGNHDMKNVYIKIKNVLQNSYLLSTHKKDSSFMEIEGEKQFTLKFKDNAYIFVGDNIVELKHETKVGSNLAASYNFNTAFVGPQNMITVKYNQFSPLSAVKSGIFKQDFLVQFHFKNICMCQNFLDLKKKCQRCQKCLKQEDRKWLQIVGILHFREQFVVKHKLFGSLQPQPTQSQFRMKQKSMF